MSGYHHGVETVEIDRGPRSVKEVRTAAMLLVGTAPIGPQQTITLVRSKADAAQFGKQVAGFTIPQALDAILTQGNALVAVVNVASDDHYVASDVTSVTNQLYPMVDGLINLVYQPVADSVVVKSSDGLTTYVEGVNYEISGAEISATTGMSNTNYRVSFDHQEAHTVTDMRIQTTYSPYAGSLVVKSADGSTTYVVEDDYLEPDAYGVIKIVLGGDIEEGDKLIVTYDRFSSAEVMASEIVGTYNPDTEVRTGLYLIEECYNTFGFKPKIILAPGFTASATVGTALISRADEFRAITIFDSESGWSVDEAITARGPLSTSNFSTGSGRVIAVYPGLNVVHPDNGETEVRPASPYVAGLIAKVDDAEGFWVSPSNHEILGAVSLETLVTWDFQNPSTQANSLNEVGITTFGKPFGSGFRLWGNRLTNWPSTTAPVNFIPVRRVADILHESLELAMLPFIDKPITNAVIADVKETANAYIRSLIQRGALLPGSVCTYDPAKNPADQIALGRLTFDITMMPPTPMERLTFESFIDTTLLSGLGA